MPASVVEPGSYGSRAISVRSVQHDQTRGSRGVRPAPALPRPTRRPAGRPSGGRAPRRSPSAGSIRHELPTPSSPVRIAATWVPSQADQFRGASPARPAAHWSMRRASRSSGSVVTTQIWLRVAPSGATSHASQCPSAECMTRVTATLDGQFDVAGRACPPPTQKALDRARESRRRRQGGRTRSRPETSTRHRPDGPAIPPHQFCLVYAPPLGPHHVRRGKGRSTHRLSTCTGTLQSVSG